MTRFVLTLLIGLGVSLGALVSGGSVLAKGKTAWVGTVNGQPVQVTSEGVYLSGKFRKAYRVTDKQKCIYSRLYRSRISDPYKAGWGKTWSIALSGISEGSLGFSCDDVFSQFKRNNKIVSKGIPEDALKNVPTIDFSGWPDTRVCIDSVRNGKWDTRRYYQQYVNEAKRRGLSCGVGETLTAQIASSSQTKIVRKLTDVNICRTLKNNMKFGNQAQIEAKRRGLSCTPTSIKGTSIFAEIPSYTTSFLCNEAKKTKARGLTSLNKAYLSEARKRGIPEDVCLGGKVIKRQAQSGTSEPKIGGVSWWLTPKPWNRDEAAFISGQMLALGGSMNVSSGEIVAPIANGFVTLSKAGEFIYAGKSDPSYNGPFANLVAVVEDKKLTAIELKKQQQTIATDTHIPLITASSRNKDEATSIIFGTVTDDTGVASLTVAGEVVELADDGSFQTQTYVPASGLDVEIVAYDFKGNKASKTLSLSRKATQVTLTQTYEKLRPSLGKRGKTNNAALALIVGIEAYENFPSNPAIYADSDAQYFADYAHYKLGVPRGNIITAVNANAKELDIRKAITKITKQSTKDKTDVFVFFAGHGLASNDEAEDVYLLPYDGDKDYLAETSLTRSEVFKLVKRIKPRSVTVFLDACYSGATRSEDKVLVAGKRRVGIKVFEQDVPEGFTVLSAAAANETSMALEEAKHGLFSYYLMRGMEGDADTNQDNKITMNEMRDYVKDKVGRQSDFKQTPQLQGDANRVLVQFQ